MKKPHTDHHSPASQRYLPGGPFLGALELVEAEDGEFPGEHPRNRMQRVGDPFLVGHDRDSLEGRRMLQDAETQLQVLDEPAGPEALVIVCDDLHDPDVAAFEQLLDVRLERAKLLAGQPARHADAGHSLRHVWQYFDHRRSPFSVPVSLLILSWRRISPRCGTNIG